MAKVKRILYLDGDDEYRKAGIAALQNGGFGPKDGFDIVELRDIGIGLQTIERDQDFIAVISAWRNVNGPYGAAGMSGIELSLRLRAHEVPRLRKLPVIFCTMDSDGCRKASAGIPLTTVLSKLEIRMLATDLRISLVEASADRS